MGLGPGQTNLYGYCGNSPVNATDPTGLGDAHASLVTMTVNFHDIGGFRWSTAQKQQIYESLDRILTRCQALVVKVNAEIARVNSQETQPVKNQMLPILNQLLFVVNSVIAGLQSNTVLNLWYYNFQAANNENEAMGRTSPAWRTRFGPKWMWIA